MLFTSNSAAAAASSYSSSSSSSSSAASTQRMQKHQNILFGLNKRTIQLGLIGYMLLLIIGYHLMQWMKIGVHHNRKLHSMYPGPQWRTNQTVAAVELISNKWLRVESHTVQTEDGQIIDDWIWIDVLDQVNILPYIAPTATSPGLFVVFRQNKYGINGPTLATAGGHIDVKHGESPVAAAKRELLEEMNYVSDEWIDLGTYRTNCNRGGGYVTAFLAKHVQKAKTNSNQHDEGQSDESSAVPTSTSISTASVSASASASAGQLAVDELEHQHVVYLTAAELKAALLRGEFGEIKWTATIALSILTIEIEQQQQQQQQQPVLVHKPPNSSSRVPSPSPSPSPSPVSPPSSPSIPHSGPNKQTNDSIRKRSQLTNENRQRTQVYTSPNQIK